MMQETHPIKSLVGHKGAVLCCCVHGESLVTAGHDRKIIVWDAGMGTIQREIIAHEHIINSLAVTSCQNRQDILILSASWDKSVKVWKLRNGQLVSTFLCHNNRVKCVKAIPHQTPCKSSPTSHSDTTVEVEVSLAVSGDDDGHIFVWDIRSAQALRLFDEHARSVVALALYFDASLNATCLVSASVDATIRLWDLSEITLSVNNDKVTTQSSICAIKTPSKYISSLVAATMNSLAPLITGTDTYTSTKSTVNTNTTTDTAITTTPTETILLAADTLGSIYIYRASTGALLVRLETRCKIISLFTTHFPLNTPCFPNQQEMNSYYTGSSTGIGTKSNSTNDFVTPERNELLLQYANMKRQHNIVNTISHHRGHSTDVTDSSVAKYVYYVPDNGSTGCFCLLPETLVDTGSTTNTVCTDVTSSIALTHTLSLSLCQSMDTLYCATSTRRSTSGGAPDNSNVIPRKNIQLQMNSMHMSRSLDYQNQYNDDNCSVGITVSQKKTPLAHSKTEPNTATVNTNYQMLKSCTVGMLNSDYNDSVNVSGNVSLNNSGKLSASNSSKALQAFNSSATPNSSKTRRVSTRAAALTNTSTATGKKHISNSSGGVMSVSINTAEPVDNILLQCFAMSNLPIKPNTQHTNNATYYLIFGGRDSVLFYCACKPNDHKIPPNAAETNTSTPGAPLSLVIPRPAVLSMTDVLTPYQSPNDVANNYSACNTGSSKKESANINNTSPSYKAFSPVQVRHTAKIGDHMHSSPYKHDTNTNTSTSTRTTGDTHTDVITDSKATAHTDSTSTVSAGEAAVTLLHNNHELSSATDTTATTTTTNLNTTTNNTYAPTPRTLPELVDESLADLEDEMSLSEVSHIHHYYNDILSGRITQRPDDVVKSGAKNKTYLSAILREDSEDDEKESTDKVTSVLSEDYKGSMLEYLHGLDKQHSTNVVTLIPPIKPSAKIPYHPANHTNTTYNNDYTPYAITSISSTSKPTLLVSGYASIVKNSSMDSGFWEAANTAKSKYSFGRIKLQSQNNTGYGGASDGSVSGGSVSKGSVYSRARNVPHLHPIGSLNANSGVNAASHIATVSSMNTSAMFTQADNTLVNRAAEVKRSIASNNAEQIHRGYKTSTIKPATTRKNVYNVPLHKK